jgi:hypothetical protein
MDQPALVNSRSPLTLATPTGQRLARGIRWGWSVAGGFVLVLVLRATFAYGLDQAVGLVRSSVGYFRILIVVSTVAGLCAGLVAPALRGYPRSCFLGFLLSVIIGSIVLSDPSLSDAALDPDIWMSLSLGGIFVGALLRAVRRPGQWPVGDNWP